VKKILVRERIDVDNSDDYRRVSYMHKAWDDGTAEYYAIYAVTSRDYEDRDITEAKWLKLCEAHEPQATYENSDWGAGLPGAGDKWASIQAAFRK
jgi:hypothetical protein